MASIRIGIGSDFRLKDQKLGLGENNPQERLDVAGIAKGKDLKVTGISSLTAYEGFLRADHQIAENTTLTFDQGPVSSLSGEIIVGTGVTVTIDPRLNNFGPELITNGTFDSNATGWTGNNAVLSSSSNQLKVDDTANSGGWSSASQEVKTEPGVKYRLEVTIGSSTDGSFVGYNAGRYTAGNAPTEYFGEFSGGQTTTIEFIAPEKITTIVLVANDDGVSYYDNVSLKKINVAEEPRAGGSEIECLKVFNTFTPPSGGTNDRPYAPKPGELYYNYDFKTIEFFDGNGWRQVDYTTRSGRSVWAGGYIDGNVRTKEMMGINIPTLGNSYYFGDLARNLSTDGRGFGSAVRGVFAGGYGIQTPGGSPGRLDDIDYITIASEGNAIDFGNLSVGRNGLSAVSSSTRGIIAGGATNQGSPGATNATNSMDYVEISTLGNAADFGDLIKERIGSGSLVNSATRGIFGAGDDYSHPAWQFTSLGQLDSITMASKGNSVDFGSDIHRQIGAGCGNDVRGCWAGGYITTQYSGSPARQEAARRMTYVTISTFGNAIDFGNLTCGSRIYPGGASTKTRGIWTGGSAYPVHYNEIDYIQFSSLGDSIDFGDLHRNKGYMTSTTSDSHGGLGGF